jgi:hypothetical protein
LIPDFAVAYFHLASAHRQAGNDNEARKAFEQGERLGLTPSDVDPVEQNEFHWLRRLLIKR